LRERFAAKRRPRRSTDAPLHILLALRAIATPVPYRPVIHLIVMHA